MHCRHCQRVFGEHTLGCLTQHLNDRDPACGCDACHRSDSTHSIDLGCWVEGDLEDVPPVLRPSLAVPGVGTLMGRIRTNVDAFLADGDFAHLEDNKEAWAGLKALGRLQEASALFTEEALREMP